MLGCKFRDICMRSPLFPMTFLPPTHTFNYTQTFKLNTDYLLYNRCYDTITGTKATKINEPCSLVPRNLHLKISKRWVLEVFPGVGSKSHNTIKYICCCLQYFSFYSSKLTYKRGFVLFSK